MSMRRFDLPKDNGDLVVALDQELGPAEMECNIHKIAWKITDYYLSGHRHFKVLDPFMGTVEIAYEKWDGNLALRYEQVLIDYLTELGRYAKMRVDPVTSRIGESLDALRKSSVGQAFLSALAQPLTLDRIAREALRPFLKYGTVGLEHYETGNKDAPDAIEVVSPRELRGVPAWVDGCMNLRADVRKRWVPAEWAREILNEKYNVRMSTNMDEIRGKEVRWGSTLPGDPTVEVISPGTPINADAFMSDDGLEPPGFDLSGKDKKDRRTAIKAKEGRVFVPLEQWYIRGDQPGYIVEHIVKVGRTIPFRQSYDEPTVSPLHVARHTDTGRYFGRGYVSPQIPFNDQVERMLASMFQNVIDLDLYGTVLTPASWGLDPDLWKVGRRPRHQTYEYDISAPQAKIETIAPVTSGTLPAQIAELGAGVQQKLSGHSDIFLGQAEGRVDSASGHGFLFDVANIPMSDPSHSFADAFAGVYAKMLQQAKERMRDPEASIPLVILDDAVAGVVVDSASGQLRLDDNPLPNPWEIKIDIVDRTPRNPQMRKQELIALFERQLVTHDQFWITSFREHLDFPGGPRDLWETYRKAMWQIIMLFRDGKEPGQILAGEHTGNPQVQLIAVQEFMNRIEFSLASDEVRMAFEKWKTTLEALLGRGFPAALAPPEELAQAQQAGQFGPPSGAPF